MVSPNYSITKCRLLKDCCETEEEKGWRERRKESKKESQGRKEHGACVSHDGQAKDKQVTLMR